MKKIICLLAIASIAFVSCKKEEASSKISAENEVAATQQEGYPVATFDKMEHDFGGIKKGERNETDFQIKNTGTADLVIINASASCGCTVPEYQKTPIKPGETSIIKVAFVPNGVGLQNKTVTLTTNTQKSTELLTIKADVSE